MTKPSPKTPSTIASQHLAFALVLAALGAAATACESSPASKTGDDGAITVPTGGVTSTGGAIPNGTGGALATGTGGAITLGTGGAPAGTGGAIPSGTGGTIPPSTCSGSRLPADHEIGDWVQDGSPTNVTSDTALYAEIDGAAPKYIDLGWLRSVFATYTLGPMAMQVAIHDMGTVERAENMFNRYLPVARVEISRQPQAVVDLSLTTSYASQAFAGRYYVEVTINDRSDAALVDLEAFTLRVLQCTGS